MTNLSSGKNKTNVIYGFLKKMLSLAGTYQTNEFIFCWDSRQSYRKMDFPDMNYKNRPLDPTKENLIKSAREQFVLLRNDILPAMGFTNVFMQSGYEADDLMAFISINIPDEYIIVTGDQDMYQILCGDRVKIHDIRTDKIFSEVDFISNYGILPSQWAEVKAIGGCGSDTVSGIVGVGEGSAIKWLLKTLKEGKIKDKIESKDNKELVDNCRRLVTIPYKGDREINIKIKSDALYSLNFMDAFNKYNCGSFIKDFDNWRKAFDLMPGR